MTTIDQAVVAAIANPVETLVNASYHFLNASEISQYRSYIGGGLSSWQQVGTLSEFQSKTAFANAYAAWEDISSLGGSSPTVIENAGILVVAANGLIDDTQLKGSASHFVWSSHATSPAH